MGTDNKVGGGLFGRLLREHREVVLYLIFGVLTTFVGWFVYFIVLIPGKALLQIPVSDTSSGRFLALYTAAQVTQWVMAVLFAFFTNRKWVFSGAERAGTIRSQLPVFAGGRVVTFFLDYGVTLFGGMALSALFPLLGAVELFGRAWNFNEILAKVVAAVIVIVVNYFVSKLLVFRKR